MSVDARKLAVQTLPATARKSIWPALITLFFGSFVGVYPVVSLNVSLHGFIGIFHTELITVQWIVTGFTLAAGVIAPVSGYAGDRFGGKRLFIFSLVGITASSILCALAWNIYALIAFRILQGLFCGLISPVALAMIYQTVPSDKQPFAVSIWSFSTVLGTALAPSISGWLQDYDWHWIFLVTVPLGIAVIIAALRILPSDHLLRRAKLDVIGLILAAAGSLSLLLLFGNMHQWGWQAAPTWVCLIIGVTCGIGFVIHELRTESPLLQLRLFRSAMFTASLSISLILSVALYAGIYFIPLYLSEMQGLSSFQVGILFLPAAFCLTCATFFSGQFYTKLGPATLIIAGGLILILTTYHFSHLHPTSTLFSIMLWLSIRNIGTGLAMTPATNAGMIAIPRELSGHASALINWIRQVFSAMTLSLLTSFFYMRLDIHQSHLLKDEASKGASWIHKTAYTLSVNNVFLISSLLIALALPLALILRKRKPTN
ncbi:hypothetical protein Back11_49160 [Paenibacillus baekrokdamisoli]|uniref:Uncharacterized protein n=1 Tax=Paenibacillus baekrokdamisoli TaxID=1712516 RepID=A0A3G9JCA8_9BACL|nr:DHA2 family efflux MFS transporter permease subunit [Paenibacillus baekrokdamisoli]MBB3068740.1 EmrB/QacA subfamily drug resistance transporter [Paenibacillus baekrokdamisoli]BBH23571.1 hypothetical protein Back11_49160 [Paenibacillus baekrokdamisoli]